MSGVGEEIAMDSGFASAAAMASDWIGEGEEEEEDDADSYSIEEGFQRVNQ